jgi:ElaB/YqjD/DUF883 family membrane-anchored ribosome-binding protein
LRRCGYLTEHHQNEGKTIMPDDTFTNPTTGATTGAGAGPDTTARFESGKTHARQAADDLRAAAEAKAQELRSIAEAKAQEYRGRAEQAYDQARTRVRTLRDDGEQYVRENPTRAVLTALGAGFVLGLIFRR